MCNCIVLQLKKKYCPPLHIAARLSNGILQVVKPKHMCIFACACVCVCTHRLCIHISWSAFDAKACCEETKIHSGLSLNREKERATERSMRNYKSIHRITTENQRAERFRGIARCGKFIKCTSFSLLIQYRELL